MSASFRPQAIKHPQPARLQRVELGQLVRVPSGDTTGKVIHPYTDDLGVRMAYVKWESGAKGLYQVSSLIAAPSVCDRCSDTTHPMADHFPSQSSQRTAPPDWEDEQQSAWQQEENMRKAEASQPDSCPNCLSTIDQPCARCATYGAHDGSCLHMTPVYPAWSPVMAQTRLNLIDRLQELEDRTWAAQNDPANVRQHAVMLERLRPYQTAWACVPSHGMVSAEHRCKADCFSTTVKRCGVPHPESGLPCLRANGLIHHWHEALDSWNDLRAWTDQEGVL
jgi:hypothetical protein